MAGLAASTSETTKQRPGVDSFIGGRLGVMLFTFGFSSGYTTGGEACDFVALRPNTIKSVHVVLPIHSGGYVFEWDSAAKKLKAYRQTAATGALAEVANGVDLSALTAVQLVCLVRSP